MRNAPELAIQIVDWTHDSTLIEVIEIIEAEMARTLQETGHGKAQRGFGNKILEKLKNL